MNPLSLFISILGLAYPTWITLFRIATLFFFLMWTVGVIAAVMWDVRKTVDKIQRRQR